MKNKTVVGIDATWLLHRAFHTPGPNKHLQVAEWCCEYASKLGARHAVAFLDGPSVFRYNLYPQYKANRREGNDAEANKQDSTGPYEWLDPLLERLTAMRFPFMQFSEYEADDLQATLAHRAPTDYKVILVAKDKDAKQNLSERTSVFVPGTGKNNKGSADLMMTLEWFKKSSGVTPQQFLDIQTLAGDKVDNVLPVGAITAGQAKKLILKQGSLANFLKNNPEVFAKFGPHITLNRNMVKLVTNCFPITDMDRQFGLPTKVESAVKRPGRNYLELIQRMSRKTLF
jgi:5'-3' exonuclease